VSVEVDLSVLRNVFQRPSWELLGSCNGKDTRLWFSKRQQDILAATTWCEICPVRWKCLSENIDVPFGIFGGFTAPQRKQIREEYPVIVNPVLLELLARKMA
jgi:hypothetical protein